MNYNFKKWKENINWMAPVCFSPSYIVVVVVVIVFVIVVVIVVSYKV
jgi:hypothetical protein